jgi:nucleoside-triphosphatase THEP1
LQKGNDALKSSSNVGNKIVIIDEAGYLELENQGWANSIKDLLNASKNHILLVIRDIFVENIIKKWNLKQVVVFNISENDYLTISNLIIKQIR